MVQNYGEDLMLYKGVSHQGEPRRRSSGVHIHGGTHGKTW